MNTFITTILGTLLFALLAPIVGCLIAGVDRIISARMQGRVGPPLLQPYWDVRKLLEKERFSVNSVEGTYVIASLVFAVLAGGIFFSGGNFLLCVFVITLSSLFFILAAYSTRSPFAEAGAARETMQVMSYEPMVLLCAMALYLTAGSFDVADLLSLRHPILCFTWPVFLGLLFVLTIKLRKSPFDISNSHHAHQELVSGITTEMSGPTLAKVKVMHWYETVLFMGWVGMFFLYASPVGWIAAIVAVVVVYLLEIWIDNNFARVKWQSMLKWAWIVALIAGGINITVLAFM